MNLINRLTKNLCFLGKSGPLKEVYPMVDSQGSKDQITHTYILYAL